MSSISPLETRVFAERIEKLGCDYVDAPVSGGDIGAKNGTLTIMVGASEEVFVRVLPFLRLMGQTITRIGNAGAGQICKIANQIIVALTIEAVGEGLLFASKAGADPVKVREALLGGFAASRVLEVHGGRMIRHAFEPGFRVELHQKDLDLALSNARTMGISLPNTAAVQEMFNACIAHGGAKLDSSAVVKVLEKLANHEIGVPGAIMMRSELATRLQAFLPPEAVLQEAEDLKPYECDGLSAYRQMPLIVALPRTEEEVAQILRVCHAAESPGGSPWLGHRSVRRGAASLRGRSPIACETETHTGD